MIKAIIMAGGAGSRLWPLSRAEYPKQFLKLDNEYTMLQSTIKRLNRLNIASTITICNEEHRFVVAEQLREIDKLDNIILEPIGKNTAPAVAIAALTTKDDPLLLVLAADHIILDEVAFSKAVNDAIPLAESGKLVTFGVTPHEAHSGYGYIKMGSQYEDGYIVESFIEKPEEKNANKYYKSGKYLWNSGIFLFKASKYLEELKKFRSDIYSCCEDASSKIDTDLDFLRINEESFMKCPSESIDYAVMEKTNDALVLKMEAGWSDIGCWSSLWDIAKKDKNGNVINGDVILLDTKNCYIRSDKKLVSTIGVDDLVVVDTKDALLVAKKDVAQDVKTIVKKLKDIDRSEWKSHREVFRPWGKYDSIDNGDDYQVKLINVKPGAKLSLQKHNYRSEHWIVVSGTAKVTNGNETFLLSKNESTFIPLGEIHALENPMDVNLELIEVQSGSYLGEDDIIRFEDIYGRLKN